MDEKSKKIIARLKICRNEIDQLPCDIFDSRLHHIAVTKHIDRAIAILEADLSRSGT